MKRLGFGWSGPISFFVALLATPALKSADIFRWVDQKGIVHFTDSLHNVPEAYRATAARIKGQSRSASPPPAPSRSLDKTSIPFQQQGSVVIVQATVNQKTSANLIVDTGASYTMISRAVAREVGIDVDNQPASASFQTANGPIQAPLAKLESLSVGGVELKEITAAIHDVFPDASVSGLLGLNFLSHFRMDIDTKNGMLHLEKR